MSATILEYFGKKEKVFVLLLLVGISVVIRIPFFNVPMITDEGGYAYVAHYWSHDYQLYRDIPFDRPQGIFLLYKLIFLLIGGSTSAIRLGAALYNAMTVLALYVFATKVFPFKVAGVIAAIYAVLSACPSIEGFTANSELFAVLPLVAAAHFAWREKWLESGLFAGLAFFLKPIGLSGLLLTLLWAIVRRSGIKMILKPIVGFAVFPAVSLMHGFSVGIRAFWDSFVGQKILTDSGFSIGLGQQIITFLKSSYVLLPLLALPLFLSLIGVIKAEPKVRVFGLLWLLSTFSGMAIGGNWFSHYYIQALPPLAFMGGFGLFEMLRLKRRSLIYLLGVSSAAFFLVREVPYWFLSPPEVSFRLYQRIPYLYSKEISEYIQKESVSTDPIYVAFYQADIYYLSKRRATVPQLYRYQFVGSQRVYQKVMKSIERREPMFVVQCQPPPAWISEDEFERILADGYELKRRYPSNIRVYQRKTSARIISFSQK